MVFQEKSEKRGVFMAPFFSYICLFALSAGAPTAIMKLPRAFLAACALPHVFAAAISSSNSTTCSEIAQRVEWRTLSESVKAEYIAAVQCLATKESVLGLDSTLYDDFAWVHAKLNLQSMSCTPIALSGDAVY